MRRLVLWCVLLVVVAGMVPVAVGAHAGVDHASDADHNHADTTDDAFNTGAIGCVEGVCYDDELGVTNPSGLDEDELEAIIYRSMARVEELRGERFESAVPVEVMSREEFRELRGVTGDDEPTDPDRWNNQVWKALFVVGDDTEVSAAIDETVGGAVTGFYQPSTNEIVLVTPDTDAPEINEQTLIHEFAHALQDQRHDLTSPQFRGDTQDADLAVTGVYEGEAVYLETRYEQRCATEWECLDEPSRGGVGGGGNQGLLIALLQPYSSGPAYIADVVEREGWSGVDDRMASPPETTRELIHRERFEPQPIDVSDDATEGWERQPHRGVDGAEVAGEASIFVMFWYQATVYDAETIDPGVLGETSHPDEQRNFAAPPSTGWVGDELVPYQRDDDDGYVWTIAWETADDVDEFLTAYDAILQAHEATEHDDGVYVIDDGGFSGAYALSVDDTQVTIVHAPTVDGLFELKPDLDPDPVEEETPGFGVGVGLAALLAALVVFRRLSQPS